MKSKLKIAIFSLTSCSGCQMEVVNLGGKFLDILKYIKVENFPLVKEKKNVKKYDVVFIEGSPVTKKNIKELKKIRKKTKFLIALGTCACLGCVQKMKNYRNKDEVIKNVYQFVKKIDNFEIKPLKDYVTIDFELSGCPINKNEFYWAICQLLAGKIPKISQRPVCYECQLEENECLLQKGQVCLGPLILGGCEAVCLKSKQSCDGCRGFLKDAKIENYIKIFKKQGIDKKDFEESLEIFGLK
ncbi:NADH:ubiquinone oxidoreductase [Candidatus Kuenenbacteria bacterium]|nr:NADH:ubiquinone oxidoreductase [Candidatus Kuenenbacteria bacterium]